MKNPKLMNMMGIIRMFNEEDKIATVVFSNGKEQKWAVTEQMCSGREM